MLLYLMIAITRNSFYMILGRNNRPEGAKKILKLYLGMKSCKKIWMLEIQEQHFITDICV